MGNKLPIVNVYLGDFMGIGDRLKEEREKLGFNQTDFGEIGQVGRKSQFSYETEGSFPDARYLADIATAGADVQYIVTGIRSEMALTPDERELLALYRTASLTGKAAAVGALQGALRGVSPATETRKIKVSGGTGHQVAGGKIVNAGGKK